MKYIHYRKLDINGRPLLKGGMTIAYSRPENGSRVFAPAFCSRKDNYSKAVGRFVAAERMDDPDWMKTVDTSIFFEEMDKVAEALGLTRFARRRRNNKAII